MAHPRSAFGGPRSGQHARPAALAPAGTQVPSDVPGSPPQGGAASGPAQPVPRRLLGGPPPAGVPLRTPPHPGRFLERHYLRPLALSQSEAARRLGISRRRMHEIVQGQRAVTPDTAIRCALAFGLPVTQWLALQADWDSYQTWKALRRHIRNG